MPTLKIVRAEKPRTSIATRLNANHLACPVAKTPHNTVKANEAPSPPNLDSASGVNSFGGGGVIWGNQ